MLKRKDLVKGFFVYLKDLVLKISDFESVFTSVGTTRGQGIIRIVVVVVVTTFF